MMRFLSVVCAAAVLCSSLFAAEEEALVNVKSEVLSKNVFRGQLRNEDPVVKSDISFQKGIFGLDVKAVNDLTDFNANSGEVSELGLDLYVKSMVYSNPAGKIINEITTFGGFELFTYPQSENNFPTKSTVEAYAGFDTMSKKLAAIHTKTTAHYDLDEANGWYIDSKVYRDFDVKKAAFHLGKQAFTTTATPEVGMGWGSPNYNKYYWDSEGSATTDWNAALKVICESKNFQFGPSITYTDLVGHDIQAAQEDSSNWIYGFMVGAKF
jgi:hypothetical protein